MLVGKAPAPGGTGPILWSVDALSRPHSCAAQAPEINPSDPVLRQQHQLQERLAAMHPPLADDALFLASLLSIPWADNPGLHLTLEEQKQRL